MQYKKRKGMSSVPLLCAAMTLSSQAFSIDREFERKIPESLDSIMLDEALQGEIDSARLLIDPDAFSKAGTVEVLVRLREAQTHVENTLIQERFLADLAERAPSAQVVGRTKLLINSIVVTVDTAEVTALSNNSMVSRVVPVGEYSLHLSDTVPHIGAQAVQDLGFTGKGITVAVIDSGVDYTHANLGGEGTPEAYANAIEDSATPDASQYPSDKVIGGYDFVGDVWPNGPREADPDPIDFDGHGTHVADIIGGLNGVAPDVEIYALSACSSVASSCNGTALLLSMEFSVDPNGDGDTSDAVDIINMSLGSNYGQPFDDDLSAAVEAATRLGVLTVASAGNGGDNPFKVGTPSAAPSALSVAQTVVPSFLQYMDVIEPAVDAGNKATATFAWSSDLTEVISGPVIYGDGVGGALNGCNVEGESPFAKGALDGQIVMVDRGACRFDEKIANIESAGGILGLVGLVTPDAPFAGGGDPIVSIPGYMINQVDADIIRSGLAVISFDPENVEPLLNKMVGSSSRGPDFTFGSIKPEIGAPGASLSAQAGTATGETAFGGTSGAAPMVSGAAALVMSAHPDWTPLQVKRALINNAETAIENDVTKDLAPISRIGGGEVRADRALNSLLDVTVKGTDNSVLSFAAQDIEKVRTYRKTLVIKNVSDLVQSIDFIPTFRYSEDEALDAVSFFVQPNIQIGPGNTVEIPFSLTVDPSKLLGNFMNSGANGNNSETLTINEIDGYLVLDMGHTSMQLPWHILPRKAADLVAEDYELPVDQIGNVLLTNLGEGTAQLEGFSIIALSEDVPEGAAGEQSQRPDIRAVGVRTVTNVPSCDANFVWQFAFNSWERQSLALGVRYSILLDVDQDGVDDYEISSEDESIFTPGSNTFLGTQLSVVTDFAAETINASFYVEHPTQSANTILTVCGEQLGMTEMDLLTNFVDMKISAGPREGLSGGISDDIVDITLAPLGERYLALAEDVFAADSFNMDFFDFGELNGASEEFGLMLVSTGTRGEGANGGAVASSETVILNKTGAIVPVTPKCGEFGVAYVDDTTSAAYIKDQGWAASFAYLCVDDACYPAQAENGFYSIEFPAVVGESYSLQFKVQTVEGIGQEIFNKQAMFSNNSCLLP